MYEKAAGLSGSRMERERMGYRDEYEGTKYKYIESMEHENVTGKMFRMDYIERLVYQGKIARSDIYLLRAVMFYRICTAKMVAEWILFYRLRYGEIECENLPILRPEIDLLEDGIDPTGSFTDRYVSTIEGRLKKLGQYSVVLHEAYVDRSSKNGRKFNYYIANDYTFHLVKTFFEDDSEMQYRGNYTLFPAHRKMAYMQSGIVAVKTFFNSLNAVITRERGFMIGAMKEIYIPDVKVDIVAGGQKWTIVIESFAISFNLSEVTEKEIEERMRDKVLKIKRLLHHDQYITNRNNGKPPVKYRVIIVTDTWDALSKVVKMANEENCQTLYSGKVFFVSDIALARHKNNFRESSIVVYTKKDADGRPLIGVQRIRPETIAENPWIS